ncbi:hypothetical protein T10_8894 [Trichinella papuae]|uniref:Uncharacterized protein n=1 Tax=Trichinella papuae TaxID=268474 RepID=A0A0V1MW91_9BILA|nr:hypothetical protein T10_8894 [Trichinella papuae]
MTRTSAPIQWRSLLQKRNEFAVTPLTSSFGVAPFIRLGMIRLKLISI